jgi:hypothetical protein
LSAVQTTRRRSQIARILGKVRFEFKFIRLYTEQNLFRLIDGQWSDDDVKDPQTQMIALLSEKRDRALTQRWGLWLTKRDPESGLKASYYTYMQFALEIKPTKTSSFLCLEISGKGEKDQKKILLC